MNDDFEWAKIRNERPTAFQAVKSSALRISLLFGGLAIALALFVVPLLDRSTSATNFAAYNPANVDPMTTASVRPPHTKIYTIRRSILQKARRLNASSATVGNIPVIANSEKAHWNVEYHS